MQKLSIISQFNYFLLSWYFPFFELSLYFPSCRSKSKQVIIKRALFMLSDTYLHHLCFIAINEMTLKRNIDGKKRTTLTVFILCSSMCLWRFNMYMNNKYTRSFPVGWMNFILVYFWLKNETDVSKFRFSSPRKKTFFFTKNYQLAALGIDLCLTTCFDVRCLWSNSKSHELWFSPYAFRFRLLSEHSLA